MVETYEHDNSNDKVVKFGKSDSWFVFSNYLDCKSVYFFSVLQTGGTFSGSLSIDSTG